MKKYLPTLALLLVLAILITVAMAKRKTIVVIIDGEPRRLVTYKDTLIKALSDEKISVGPKDRIDPALNSKLTNKEIITIKRAVNIIINVDGKELAIQSSEDILDSLLKTEGITLGDEDKIKPGIGTKLSEGMKVEIIRVGTKIFKSTAPVDFKTIVKYDRGVANTKKLTSQEGKLGEKEITTSVRYENNKEVSKKVIDQVVIKQPVDKIIVQGTYPVMPVSRGGDPVPYSKSFTVRATAYSAIHGIGKTYTASGRLAVRNPDGYSTVAVDPKVIPLGTKIFIQNYGFAIAADTGTAITGNTIDVFFDTYKEACNWAVKYVNVYILK